MVNNDVIKINKLNEKASLVVKPEDAAGFVTQYEDIIETKKKTLLKQKRKV